MHDPSSLVPGPYYTVIFSTTSLLNVSHTCFQLTLDRLWFINSHPFCALWPVEFLPMEQLDKKFMSYLIPIKCMAE